MNPDTIKCSLTLPNLIERKYVHVANKIITGNIEDNMVLVNESEYRDDTESMPLASMGAFIGNIPKQWLTPITEEKKS